MIRRDVAQLGRYLSVGVVNLTVGLTVIYACKGLFGLGDVAANAIGYAVGFVNSFMLNSRWTFDYRGPQGPALVKFLGVSLVAYAVNLATVVALIDLAGVNGYLAQAMGIPPYVLTGYLASKFLVFRSPPGGHRNSA